MSRPRATAGSGSPARSRASSGISIPTSGKLDKIPLGRGAAPHGVIVGPDGAAWVTEGGQNAIARVDPATTEVKLFPLPKDFSDANLNTLTFDKSGILWFTGQSGVYGRVDPKTGKVEAWASPRGSGTYGITTTPSGEVWYASLASDHIAQIDTATHAVTVVEPPRKGVGPRRIWSDSKGMLWSSFWNGGGIGRYDPMKKSWTTYHDAAEPQRHLLGLCRRQGPGMGDRLARQRDPALRSGDRDLRDLPERQARRGHARDAGPARRSLGRRVRQ